MENVIQVKIPDEEIIQELEIPDRACYKKMRSMFLDVEPNRKKVFAVYRDLVKTVNKNPHLLGVLALVLNHRLWNVYENNTKLGKLYERLWGDIDNYALDTLKDEDLSIYLKITD